MAKPALGRGLGALLGNNPVATPQAPSASNSAAARDENSAAAPAGSVRIVPVQRVRPCAFQPRKDFPAESLQELADSIKSQGIVQPLVVRESNGQFELIAGERRWRAAQLAGLVNVPVVIRQASDREVLELALIENLQRENLNPLEEALGYSTLIEQFQLTQEQAAAKVGRSRAAVANAVRLLKLSPAIQENVRRGEISVGHAKVLLSVENLNTQSRIAQRIVAEGLSVRQTEALLAPASKPGAPSKPAATITPPKTDLHVQTLENKLRERLGTRVSLRYAQGKGSLEISFFNEADLQRVLEILGISDE
jgi:ParB family chromosome partitioning protein